MTTAADVILYIGSAILSIYFVGGVYKEYAVGASILEESETPVTALDNPTVTLCFESWSELNRGDHFEAWYALYDSDGNYRWMTLRTRFDPEKILYWCHQICAFKIEMKKVINNHLIE